MSADLRYAEQYPMAMSQGGEGRWSCGGSWRQRS